MRWLKWLCLTLGILAFVMGLIVQKKDVFQVSTGWMGLFVFGAAFLVLLGVERLVDELPSPQR